MPRPKKTTPTVIDPVTTYDITPAKLPEFAHPLPPPHMADDYLKAKVGVATTEPDTNLNPDRAQVAAVADLPRESEPVVVDTPPPPLESVLAANDATIAEQSARIALMDVERANHRKEIEMWMNAVQKVTAERDERDARIASLTGWGQRCEEEISRKDDRIAELEAKADPPGWRESRAYRDGLALDDIRCAILDTGHPLGDDSDPELTPLRLVREVLAKDARIATLEKVNHATRTYFNVRLDATQQEVEDAMVREYARVVALESLTPADLIAGYRAVASGQVKAAEWKGRRLVRLHGNPEPIAMYDHPEPPPGCMPSGFVAEVASGTTRIMSPPLKTEAEARAWCEARCGWTVVQ